MSVLGFQSSPCPVAGGMAAAASSEGMWQDVHTPAPQLAGTCTGDNQGLKGSAIRDFSITAGAKRVRHQLRISILVWRDVGRDKGNILD